MDGVFQFSVMCHHVAVQVVPNALKESETFIFKGSGSTKIASYRELTRMWDKGSVFSDCFVLKGFFCVCSEEKLTGLPLSTDLKPFFV